MLGMAAGKLTMGVVGTVAFGVDLHTQDVDENENSEAAQKLISAAQSLFNQNRECLLPPIFEHVTLMALN